MSAVLNPLPTFSIIPKESIDALWPAVRGDIARALATSNGEATVDDTLLGLRRGATSLMLFFDGDAYFGVVCQFLVFPQFKIARVLPAFGKNMRQVDYAIEEAEKWAKTQGCKCIEAWVATQSRVRLFSRFGYEPTYTIVRKDLT